MTLKRDVGRDHRHRALREVDDARGAPDQHEREREQRRRRRRARGRRWPGGRRVGPLRTPGRRGGGASSAASSAAGRDGDDLDRAPSTTPRSAIDSALRDVLLDEQDGQPGVGRAGARSSAHDLRRPRAARARATARRAAARAGRATSARPSASICRSPPESWWPGAVAAPGERLEQLVDLVDRGARVGPVPAPQRRRAAGSRRRSARRPRRGPRARGRCPRRTRSSTLTPARSLPVEPDARRRAAGTSAGEGAQQGGLARAVGAEQRRRCSPAGTSRSTSCSTGAPPYPTVRPRTSRQRRGHGCGLTSTPRQVRLVDAPGRRDLVRGAARRSPGRSRARRSGRRRSSRSRRGARRAARRSRSAAAAPDQRRRARRCRRRRGRRPARRAAAGAARRRAPGRARPASRRGRAASPTGRSACGRRGRRARRAARRVVAVGAGVGRRRRRRPGRARSRGTVRPRNSPRPCSVRATPRRGQPRAGAGAAARRRARSCPRCGRTSPQTDVEQRGLAGAVRADEADDLALVHVEGHVVEGVRPAEAHAELAHREPAAESRAATRVWTGVRSVRTSAPLRVGERRTYNRNRPDGMARSSDTGSSHASCSSAPRGARHRSGVRDAGDHAAVDDATRRRVVYGRSASLARNDDGARDVGAGAPAGPRGIGYRGRGRGARSSSVCDEARVHRVDPDAVAAQLDRERLASGRARRTSTAM